MSQTTAQLVSGTSAQNPTFGDVDLSSINNGNPISGTRNRIINGGTAIDQRNAGAAQTITAAAALAYTVDRWYAYCTGANVSGVRVAGAVANTYRYQFTGAASVTAIGFGQRIEAQNCADMAGTTVTLSADLANSLLTSVTWTAYYATTTDTFGTLASPTKTQIATGTFTVSSTVTRYNAQISVPAAATTGIEIVFTVAAQTSGTWTIGNIQLESGPITTPFERRSYGAELALAQRYYYRLSATGTSFSMFAPSWNETTTTATGQVKFPVQMRIRPTALEQSGTAANYSIIFLGSSVTCTAVPIYIAYSTPDTGVVSFTGTGLTAGQGSALVSASGNSTAYLAWSTEL